MKVSLMGCYISRKYRFFFKKVFVSGRIRRIAIRKVINCYDDKSKTWKDSKYMAVKLLNIRN